MGFPTFDFIKVVVGGACGVTDVWRCTSNWTYGDTDIATVDLNTAAASWLSSFNTNIWSNATTGLKTANRTDVDLSVCNVFGYHGGIIVNEGSATITAVPGTASAPNANLQCLCISCRSGFYGRSFRGRMYLPATAFPAPAGLYGATAVNNIVDHTATWLGQTTMTPFAAGTLRAAVLSLVKADMFPIVKVDADYVPDTQRGRQSSLQSARHSHSVP